MVRKAKGTISKIADQRAGLISIRGGPTKYREASSQLSHGLPDLSRPQVHPGDLSLCL